MSRFSDYDDGDYRPGAADLWQANVRRALGGKRGKKALAELREALLAAARETADRGGAGGVVAPAAGREGFESGRVAAFRRLGG